MAEILKNNKTALRGCILYEFLQGKPIYEAYKTFCKTIGNDVIEYKEFKNWFNCFANGKADLEDENFDKESLTFSDLPAEILGEIVEKLDLVSRLRTRKVSRRLQSVVDKQQAYYDKIEIFTDDDKISIVFDDISVNYKNKENGCLIEYKRSEDQTEQKFINDEHFLEMALNDLEIALKKPKFQLKSLELVLKCAAVEETAKILKFLKSFKSPIRIKSLNFEESGNIDVLSILALLKSGTLEEINLGRMNEGIDANELVKMDQWKQAKDVFFGDIPLQLDDFLHFDKFSIFVDSISAQDMLRLLDTLSKSASFEHCCLHILDNESINIDEIGIALGATVDESFCGPMIEHNYPIPGTEEFLDLEASPYIISIVRNP